MSTPPTGRNAPDQLLDHEYDEIQEYDNPLPRWWVWGFWATIVFSVVYLFDPDGSWRGPGIYREYSADMRAFREAHPQGGPSLGAEALAALARDPKAVASGKAVYAANCAACHGADGGGVIGPNLADDAWLHGGTLPEIQKTVTDGVQAKGMPAWGKLLKPDQLTAVVAYVHTLQGTRPAKPKAPEGVVAPVAVGR